MNKSARCLKIIEILQEKGEVEVNDLAAMFNTSDMTIRRDLNFLASQYNIKRTYGGATMPRDGGSVIKVTSFDEERITNKDVKLAIARKAASLVQPRQRIFIDAGSTTRGIAGFLIGEYRNVVVTNNITVLQNCLKQDNIATIMIGGDMIPLSGCSCGPVAEAQLKQYRFDIAFIGAAAVGADGKLYDGYSPEARLKTSLFGAADKIYLLVDSSKFNTYDFSEFADLGRIDGVITDRRLDAEALKLLNRFKTRIFYAGTEQTASD